MKRNWPNAAISTSTLTTVWWQACFVAEWNAKLLALEEARAMEERYNQRDQQRVNEQERADIEQVPERFRRFWNAPKTTARQRKRAVRLLIEDVTVLKAEHIIAHIRTHSEGLPKPSPCPFLLLLRNPA